MTPVEPDLAALACGVQPATLRQWVRRGKLQRYGRGRTTFFVLEDIMDLVGAEG